MNYWQRTSTWGKVKDSLTGILSIGQLTLILNDSQHIYNVLCFIGQVAAILIPTWFEDKNNNDVADIFEKEVTVKVTSDSPIKIDTETKTNETKP
jgi:hypothetical protein